MSTNLYKAIPKEEMDRFMKKIAKDQIKKSERRVQSFYISLEELKNASRHVKTPTFKVQKNK